MRPRYGRIAVLTAAAIVTGVAVLGGFGLVPSGPEDASADSGKVASGSGGAARQSAADRGDVDRRTAAKRSKAVSSAPVRPADRSRDDSPAALPADSGSGHRVVFSEGEQRVWLVADSGEVLRTYLVSGSVYDNLDPGTYEVYSRSRYAVGIGGSGTMEYFVRFTHGDAGAAIGFHTIPLDDGAPVQTAAELGTPLSHGCIRQRTADAVALWDFAPLGTTVVVTA